MAQDATIYQFSPKRSGSTLITQILRSIFSNVIKTHRFHKTTSPIVVAYRHPCGNFCSTLRVRSRSSGYEREIFAIQNLTALRGIVSAIIQTKKGYRRLRQYNRAYGNKPLYLCYERFTQSYDYIFDEMEKKLAISICREQREIIKAKTSRERNSAIANTFPGFNDYDAATGIHGLHVSDSELDWQVLLPDRLKTLLLNVFLRREVALYNRLAQSRNA
jgi:hypothetical protein